MRRVAWKYTSRPQPTKNHIHAELGTFIYKENFWYFFLSFLDSEQIEKIERNLKSSDLFQKDAKKIKFMLCTMRARMLDFYCSFRVTYEAGISQIKSEKCFVQ